MPVVGSAYELPGSAGAAEARIYVDGPPAERVPASATSGGPTTAITPSEAVHRGFSMLVVAVLGLSGLTFGAELFAEADPIDKIDNTLLVVVAVVALAWYLASSDRLKRTFVPFALVGAAIGVQILGFVLEVGDPTALGDDIPGLILYTALLVVLWVVRRANDQVLLGSPTP